MRGRGVLNSLRSYDTTVVTLRTPRVTVVGEAFVIAAY